LIHSHGIWQYPTWAVKQHHKRFKTPVIVSPRGMLDQWALRNSPLVKRLALLLFQRSQLLKDVTCFHALCDSEAASIRNFGCTAPIAIIPNGASQSEFNSPLIRVGDATRPYLIFMGRLHPKKGISQLVKAWADFSKTSKSNLQLTIVGEGEESYRQKIVSQINALSIPMSLSIDNWTDASEVILIGDCRGKTKESLLGYSEAFILPSLSEGLPVAVLEAWSHAKPVLMTRECNLPEGFSENAAIEIYTDDSLETGIKNSLFAFQSQPTDQRRIMGQNGSGLIESKFNWTKIGNMMAGVYRWLLGRGDRPECVRID